MAVPIQGNYKWIDILPKLIDNYINTYHTTIKMKPVEVTPGYIFVKKISMRHDRHLWLYEFVS